MFWTHFVTSVPVVNDQSPVPRRSRKAMVEVHTGEFTLKLTVEKPGHVSSFLYSLMHLDKIY